MLDPERHPRGLLDTRAVISLPRVGDAAALPEAAFISTITLADLSFGPLVTADEEERVVRQAHVQQAEADFDRIPFDAAAAGAFGGVAAPGPGWCAVRSGPRRMRRQFRR